MVQAATPMPFLRDAMNAEQKTAGLDLAGLPHVAAGLDLAGLPHVAASASTDRLPADGAPPDNFYDRPPSLVLSSKLCF